MEEMIMAGQNDVTLESVPRVLWNNSCADTQ